MEVVSFFSRVFGLIFVIMVELIFNFKIMVEVNTRARSMHIFQLCYFSNVVVVGIY